MAVDAFESSAITDSVAASISVRVNKTDSSAVTDSAATTVSGVKVSKANAYVVAGPPDELAVSKASLYAVAGPPDGLAVSKAVIYVVGSIGGIKYRRTRTPLGTRIGSRQGF